MAIKYIYLDDEDYSTIGFFVDEVKNANDQLVIEHRHPGDYDVQIEALENEKFDGLILDLRLDQNPDVSNVHSKFRATTLAQELRTRATEQANESQFIEKDFPIALWSMDARLRQSFTFDTTGHDLFDLKCVKEDIGKTENAHDIANKLVSLVNGYKTIRSVIAEKIKNTAKLQKLLGLKENVSFLDPRVFDQFGFKTNGITPPHEYARFIIKALLEFPGALIDKELLLVRLGIDRQKSDVNAIEELLAEYLNRANYTGVFSDGWQRWWNYLIEDWWRQLEGNPGPLRSTTAEQRVSFIQEATGLTGLISAKPIKTNYSTDFWAICQVTNKPLSPRNGFIIKSKGGRPWQDRLYINTGAALNGTYKRKGLAIDSLEEERLKNLRQQSRVEKKPS